MLDYTAWLQFDDGELRVKVQADSLDEARRKVAEGNKARPNWQVRLDEVEPPRRSNLKHLGYVPGESGPL